MKKEANFQIVFNKYLRATGMQGYFELKQTKTMFSFSAFEPHQITSLLAAQEHGLVYKLSDSDMRIKPFDCISTPPLTAYIVISFTKFFCIIPVNAFVAYVQKPDHNSQKSLTMLKARELAYRVVKM